MTMIDDLRQLTLQAELRGERPVRLLIPEKQRNSLVRALYGLGFRFDPADREYPLPQLIHGVPFEYSTSVDVPTLETDPPRDM